MQTKWNPIVNGDLNGIPRDKRLLFTGIDGKEPYVDFGYIESRLEGYGFVSTGDAKLPVEAKYATAWMELPEPYEPGRCDVCKHNEHWTDCFGDRWSKCKFSERQFVKGCPIEKEVD